MSFSNLEVWFEFVKGRLEKYEQKDDNRRKQYKKTYIKKKKAADSKNTIFRDTSEKQNKYRERSKWTGYICQYNIKLGG